ncbi:Ig-like domain-containing protein [Kitasatospora sp. NPDC006697]|uniref:L,D-transpeptidase n=1 Tax=Kitasatospora sp. NPDC006697 TaxID=3364020 RepID=UPI0036BF2C2A
MRSKRLPNTAAALLIGGALLQTTACGGGTDHPADAAKTGAAAPVTVSASTGSDSTTAPGSGQPSKAAVSVQPADGAKDVAPNGSLKVSVSDGKLTKVTVTGPDGKPVDGAVGTDGSWTPAVPLAVSAKYRVSADAVDAAGAATTATSSFSTLTPRATNTVQDNLGVDGTYGVGMIIRVDFDKPVKDKKAAEQAIAVQASDGTPVRGHWFGDKRLDIRPEHYWKTGTKVTVHRRITGVELSPGVYGGSDVDESFTVARSKISTVDAAAHLMKVEEDGFAPAAIKVTAGADLNPSWNGTMVVFEKLPMVHMDSATTDIKGDGYVDDEPHGLKITGTGSYVHGNPRAVEAAGLRNISHGCIGLPDTEQGDPNSVAGKYWTDSMIGDVVIVHGSIGKPVAPDNGLSGWSLPWAQW